MMPKLTCVLIYALKKCVPDDDFRDTYSENFVMFAGEYS